jgi:hypothetical protein
MQSFSYHEMYQKFTSNSNALCAVGTEYARFVVGPSELFDSYNFPGFSRDQNAICQLSQLQNVHNDPPIGRARGVLGGAFVLWSCLRVATHPDYAPGLLPPESKPVLW